MYLHSFKNTYILKNLSKREKERDNMVANDINKTLTEDEKQRLFEYKKK